MRYSIRMDDFIAERDKSCVVHVPCIDATLCIVQDRKGPLMLYEYEYAEARNAEARGLRCFMEMNTRQGHRSSRHDRFVISCAD